MVRLGPRLERRSIPAGGIASNLDPENLNKTCADCPGHELIAHDDGISERFSMGWTRAGGGPSETTHNYFHRGVYYFAYFYPSNATFMNVNGQDLGQIIDYGVKWNRVWYLAALLSPAPDKQKGGVDYVDGGRLSNHDLQPLHTRTGGGKMDTIELDPYGDLKGCSQQSF
jgi:hypothetical protein